MREDILKTIHQRHISWDTLYLIKRITLGFVPNGWCTVSQNIYKNTHSQKKTDGKIRIID